MAFFSEAFSSFESLLEEDSIIMVEGLVSERNGRLSLRAEKAMPLEEAREKLTKAINVIIPYEDVEEELLTRLKVLCERHIGDCELLLHLQNGDVRTAVVRSRTIRIKPCDEFLHGVDEILGPKRVSLTAQIQPPVVQVREQRWRQRA
jgi:DNA polymerase-3 subunit alpha